MIAATIQICVIGLALTVVGAALHARRRSDDRVIRRRLMHVAIATAALGACLVPWLIGVGRDLSAVDWLVLARSMGPWLTLFAVLLFVEGSLFDLSRDRICRRCGFDLRMTDGLRCNECGRTAKSEAHLRAIRPSRTLQVIAVLVLAGGFWMWRGVEMRAWGWRGAIPDFVLVAFWPWLPDAVVSDGGPAGGALGVQMGWRRGTAGTLEWRLDRLPTLDARRDAIAARIDRRLVRARQPEEVLRLLAFREMVAQGRHVPRLDARVLDVILGAMERSAAPHDPVVLELAQRLASMVFSQPYETLRAHRERLHALALRSVDGSGEFRAVTDAVELAAAFVLVSAPADQEELPPEVIAGLLTSAFYGPAVAHRLPAMEWRSPRLREALLAESRRLPPNASVGLVHSLLAADMMERGGDGAHRETVERALELIGSDPTRVPVGLVNGLLRTSLPSDLESAVVVGLAPSGAEVDRRIEALIAADDDGVRDLLRSAIDATRATLEAAVARGFPDEPRRLDIAGDALPVWTVTSALISWQTARRAVLQPAALLAWDAAMAGHRHDAAAALLEAADLDDVNLEQWLAPIDRHLRSIGAIGDRSPAAVTPPIPPVPADRPE